MSTEPLLDPSENFRKIETWLEAQMKAAKKLTNARAQQDFVTLTFTIIYDQYNAELIRHNSYINLVNRLAAYKNGQFNDYIDSLTGAAQFEMLDMAIAASQYIDVAGLARSRSAAITEIFGITPAQPNYKEDHLN